MAFLGSSHYTAAEFSVTLQSSTYQHAHLQTVSLLLVSYRDIPEKHSRLE
jgi:hypothetical protein